jgi:transcriptional regulator with XRE-family HTH domain
MSLGSEIAAARKKAGLSQKDLAEETLKEEGAPISPQFLNDIERDRRRPGTYILNALAARLGLDADRLHFLAGQVPPDLVEGRADSERVGDSHDRSTAEPIFRGQPCMCWSGRPLPSPWIALLRVSVTAPGQTVRVCRIVSPTCLCNAAATRPCTPLPSWPWCAQGVSSSRGARTRRPTTWQSPRRTPRRRRQIASAACSWQSRH